MFCGIIKKTDENALGRARAWQANMELAAKHLRMATKAKKGK
jgi:hypothetical protein